MVDDTLIYVSAATILLLIGGYVYFFMNSAQKLRKWFESTAQKHNLTIHCRELFKAGMLGIDCRTKKILYTRRDLLSYHTTVIDLSTVTNCTYRKVYLKAARKRALPRTKLVVREVLLEFDHEDLTTASIPFYHYWLDNLPHREAAEQKAERWEVLVRKLLVK